MRKGVVKGLTKTVIGVLPANETPREELLKRDVFIQFNEIRRLRAENEALKKENEKLKLENKRLQFENDYVFLSSLHQ
jgi:cell shape-determining protein MreC